MNFYDHCQGCEDLKTKLALYLQALKDIREKAGSHTVDVRSIEDPNDSGFAGIWCVANKAVTEGEGVQDPLITVCAVCSRACCWQGEFMCDGARNAGTKEVRKSDLVALKLEHPDYWKRHLAVKGVIDGG